jgi:AraC-like DNA-binding protein
MDSLDHTVLQSGLTDILKEYLNGIQRHLPTLRAADIPSVVEATSAIVIACISPSRASEGDAAAPIQAARLERARQFVEANLQSQALGPDLICQVLGISRRQLYYLFEPSGGVAAYIRRRRLRASHAIVVKTSQLRHIQTIAFDHGFSNAALFSRLFKAQFGYSPKEAREAAASGSMYREALPATIAEWLGHHRS